MLPVEDGFVSAKDGRAHYLYRHDSGAAPPIARILHGGPWVCDQAYRCYTMHHVSMMNSVVSKLCRVGDDRNT